MKLKLMSMAAMALSALLCLTTTGAWAGKLEPLITIESTGDNASFTSGSKTFDNKATVTFSGNVGNDNDNWGWYTYSKSEITLTVTAAEGYTITGVKFYNNSGSAFVDEAPFQAILVYDGGVVTKVNGTSIGQLGVTKIEVYGYAGTPEPATVAVTGVTLAPTTATLTLGETETVTLTATVDPDDATDKSVTWSSSNGAVATVSNEGVVTAVAAGTATITVTATNGTDVTTDDQTATCTVTVAEPTYKVSLEEGTEDADNWQGKAGEGEYQVLPLEGVAAGMAVSVKYIGTKKVKSVKAVKKAPADPQAVPLTMEALTAGTVVVNIMDPYTMKPGELSTGMKYSVNGGEKHLITTTTTIEDLVAGDKVAFYGNGNNITSYFGTMITGGTAEVKVYGNIMSLIDETGYATLTTLPNQGYAFPMLFNGNTNLTDASGLLLPATTLADGCYAIMFSGCTSLTAAPALPATTLAGMCYTEMFSGCTSLTTAPVLPATTLAGNCYNRMFYGCTSLTAAPELTATTLAEGCYSGMFNRCTSLVTAPTLPATTLADDCYSEMFYDCTSLTAAPTLSVTTLAESCYNSMFSGSSLTTAPELPATTLAKDCYAHMFNGCTNLTDASGLLLPATTLANGCYRSMFENCTNLTAAPELPATTLVENCYKYMFEGCTSLTTSPVLPATTLVASCYYEMFKGCTSLSSITCLATAGINQNTSTYNWVGGVASTGTFTKASGATWPTGINGIPSGWTLVPPAVKTLAEATAGDIGMVVCADGHLHDAKTAVPSGCTAVGILGKVTETGHGLILALQDATQQSWNTINGWTSETTYAGTTLKVLPDDAARGSLTSYTTLGETTVSNWAVAQKSDYEAIFTNLGSTKSDSDGTTYDDNVNAYITTGVGGTAISGYNWSATLYYAGSAWYFRSSYWDGSANTASYSVRPMLGF